MKEKLDEIFNFLKENRKYNKELQSKFYSSIVISHNTKEEKIISILYNIASTQSQPKIDNLASFYKFIFEESKHLNSFKDFVNRINPNKEINFLSLYEGMNNQNGWGNKTAALFTKTIYHLHNDEYHENLKIWNDVPANLSDSDKFYLPVDAVIIAIFYQLENKNWNFKQINSILEKYYKGIEIEVWDDLWFWGFITQEGSGMERNFKWNENKYWMIKESNKNAAVIEEIKYNAKLFLEILNKNKKTSL